MNSNKVLTLYELNGIVRETLEERMDRSYWVMAELSDVRESRGHCYMELVQFPGDGTQVTGSIGRTTGMQSRTPVAKASARCWHNTWQLLRPHFERVAGQPLRAGMKVMLEVYPQFHEAYGFSWIITDMNPEYTMGDMMRRRQEIIRQLKEEGVFDLQRELILPMFAQRIAVISSATAAGYGDFCNQLADNSYGLAFQAELFPAVMQGEQVEESVIAALNEINDRIDEFDVVVIIRGGGATTDMSGFDTLALAENVANFPLPIITGIGHDRDESVLDMVSHTRVKTPTAAAAFLVDHLMVVADRIKRAESLLARSVSERMQYQKLRIEKLAQVLPHLPRQRLTHAAHRVESLQSRLQNAVVRVLEKRNYRLSTLEQQLKSLDPQELLKRGYSITLHDGKAVRDSAQLHPGDEVETRVEHGSFRSIVSS